MELKDLNPLNLFKKGGSNTAVMEPPAPEATPQPQAMSSGAGEPPTTATAVGAEGNGPSEKPGDPQPQASVEDVKNTAAYEVKTEPNQN